MRTLTATAPAVPVERAFAPPRVEGLGRSLGALAPLFLLVGVSTVIRDVVAFRRPVPTYFPDEYIYAALGRSLAHGHLQIRGTTAHFPALLEPLLAAPIWRFFSAPVAYHLVQCENALFASLAAIPVYALARRLGLGTRFALFCAAYCLLIPSLGLDAYVLSDPLAYTLALAAIVVAVDAIAHPRVRRQVVFVGLAALASLARVEYFALFPAYLVTAAVIEGRSVLRSQRAALLAICVPGLAAVAAALGYYSAGLQSLRLDATFGRWALLYLFLLSVETGVVLIPGAIVGLLRARGRTHRTFAVFFAALAPLLLFESTTPAVDPSRFKERYLFVLLALLPPAFGLYLRYGRPLRSAVIAAALVVAAAAARLPLSQYAASTFKSDSQFLAAVSYAESRLSVGSGSLVVALVATGGALLAVLLATVDVRRVALAFAIACIGAASVAAAVVNVDASGNVRGTLPRDLGWIDAAHAGPVTLVATRKEPSVEVREALFWNASIGREVIAAGGVPTDGFGAPRLRIAQDGRLLNTTRTLLVDDLESTVTVADATQVVTQGDLTLWRAAGVPRLRLLFAGRYDDGWLAPAGRLRAWPSRVRRDGVLVSFRLSLPRSRRTGIRMHLGSRNFVLDPGSSLRVRCRSDVGALDIPFSSSSYVYDSRLRPTAARASALHVRDVRAGESPPSCAATT